MDIRYPPDPVRFERMNTQEIREAFLVDCLFTLGFSPLVYSAIDRSVVGTAVPGVEPILLAAPPELAAEYFAQRREIGVINLGEPGTIVVDGETFRLEAKEALYVGRESRAISFVSERTDAPAMFYLVSYPAHTTYPTRLIRRQEVEIVSLGDQGAANVRTIYKCICPGIVESCQLVLGYTDLAAGSVWNTMPCHTHERRSEIYLYFDLPDDAVVFHLMGKPDQTRNVVVRNGQAVLSPSWSIHAGAGTQRYAFVWAMGGENQAFADMDGIGMGAVG